MPASYRDSLVGCPCRCRQFPQPRYARHGFTLIELLVVVAIISLLVSILLPSLVKARDLAKNTVCATNQRQIALMVLQYANENDDIITPYATNGNGDLPTAAPLWYDRLAQAGYLTINASSTSGLGVLRCPADDREAYEGRHYQSYAANRYTMGDGSSAFPFRRIGELDNSSALVLTGDSPKQGGPVGTYWSPFGASAFWWLGWGTYGIGFNWERHSRDAHYSDDGMYLYNGRGVVSLVDGHAEILSGDLALDEPYLRYYSPGGAYPLLIP